MSISKEEYESVNEASLAFKRSKTRWSLFPWEQLQEVGDVFTEGAKKYKDEGWKQCDTQLYHDAIIRHVMAYMKGEQKDSESGFDHLSHVIANALILRWKDGQAET
jgi:hypothetical protein